MEEFIPWIWFPTVFVIIMNLLQQIVSLSREVIHSFFGLFLSSISIFHQSFWSSIPFFRRSFLSSYPFFSSDFLSALHYVSFQVSLVVIWFRRFLFFSFIQLPFFSLCLLLVSCVSICSLTSHPSSTISMTCRSFLSLRYYFPSSISFLLLFYLCAPDESCLAGPVFVSRLLPI